MFNMSLEADKSVSSTDMVVNISTAASPLMQNNPVENSEVLDMNLGTMKQEILRELTVIFNKTVTFFFNNDVQSSLEGLVEAKFTDIANQSTANASVLDQTIPTVKRDIEERVNQLELTSEQKMNQINAKVDELMKEAEKKNLQIINLTEQNEKLAREVTSLTNENLSLHERDAKKDQPSEVAAAVNQRLSVLERKVDDVTVDVDKVQQYTRLETAEFKGIPKQGSSHHPEDCYEIIKEFCDRYLNVTVRRYDISIAHRQFNPAEKRKEGRNYIPAIYVKFVNRFVARKILKRKHQLKNFRNRYGGKFSICENLTLTRRLLWDSTESELSSYRFKWIRNGNIFVKKDAKSRPIKIVSENVLNQLIEEQNELNVINPAAKDDGSSNPPPQSEMPSTTSQSRQPSHNRTPISGQRPPRHSPGPSHPQLSPSRLPLLQSQPIQTHTENLLHDPDAVFEPSASTAH